MAVRLMTSPVLSTTSPAFSMSSAPSLAMNDHMAAYQVRQLPPMDFDQSAFLQPQAGPPRRGSITDPMLHAHSMTPTAPPPSSDSRRGSIASITEPMPSSSTSLSSPTAPFYTRKPRSPSPDRYAPAPAYSLAPSSASPRTGAYGPPPSLQSHHAAYYPPPARAPSLGVKRKPSGDDVLLLNHPNDPSLGYADHTDSLGFYSPNPSHLAKRRSSAFSTGTDGMGRLGTLSIGGSTDSRRDSLASNVDRRGSSSSYSSSQGHHSPYGPWPATAPHHTHRYTFPPSADPGRPLPLHDQLASFDFPPSRRPSLPPLLTPGAGPHASPNAGGQYGFDPPAAPQLQKMFGHPPMSPLLDNGAAASSGGSVASTTTASNHIPLPASVGPGNPLLGDLSDLGKDSPYSRSPELRVSHKLAERKRRKEMKELFDELRDTLPTERGIKNSKWEILSKAIDYVNNLKESNQILERDNDYLRSHLSLGPNPVTAAIHPPPPLNPPDPSTIPFTFNQPSPLTASTPARFPVPNYAASAPPHFGDPSIPASPRQPLSLLAADRAS